MLSFFKKDPTRALVKQYRALLEQARDAQRGGDIKRYAELTGQAEDLIQKIEALRKNAA
jgi:molybdenum-dependent DNA-binding transcriptional regulator ModE